MAEEAALSRLYAGIYYRFDNEAGLALGHAIGTRAQTWIVSARRPSDSPFARIRRYSWFAHAEAMATSRPCVMAPWRIAKPTSQFAARICGLIGSVDAFGIYWLVA